jgi:proteasome lid subunit RPN8/RPN11
MSESDSSAKLSSASAPEYPFPIEYSPRALDDIRLEVVEAFFSVPHGGVEIGGILFGNWDGKRLAITDYAALDCEHAFGPTFTLSERDQARLADLLTTRGKNGVRPVGWYHSHTRSAISLSDADEAIHRRFFPEAWQVALVLKPQTFQPTKAGFFFRGADGAIHAETSYKEFVLTPLPMKPAPSAEPEPEPSQAPTPFAFPDGAPKTRPATSMAAETREHSPVPKFLDLPPRPSRRWQQVALPLLAFAAMGAAAYLLRDLWMPRVLALAQQSPSPTPPPPPLGLNTIDSEGQLQIHWNANSAVIQRATEGLLSIDAGGPAPQQIPLDKAHLRSGVFTFERQTERVDVSLSLTQPAGPPMREVTTFMGKLPPQKPVEDPAIRQERDRLKRQLAQMDSDLNAEIARNSKLKKTVSQLTKQLREQQRARDRTAEKE